MTPDFDFTTAEIYCEEGGQWQLYRNWNEHPAREHEVEQLYIAWLGLARIVRDLVTHYANGNLVIAEGLDGTTFTNVIRFLAAAGDAVNPPTASEVSNAGTS